MADEGRAALEARIRAMIDDQLIASYWDATKHFGTTDLVIIFDESEKSHPVSASSRMKLLASPNVPEALTSRIARPAVEAAKMLTASQAAFWLVVFFEDGESGTVAVNAKLLAPGGHA